MDAIIQFETNTHCFFSMKYWETGEIDGGQKDALQKRANQNNQKLRFKNMFCMIQLPIFKYILFA